MDAKARVADFLRSQPSVVADDALSWSIVTTGPYMELLMGVRQFLLLLFLGVC